MLRHLVFLNIQNKLEVIISIRGHLEALSKKMPGCTQFHFGECLDDKMNYYFFMDFEDETQRDYYVNHPEHIQIAKEIIIPQLKEGIKSVVVFDYMHLNFKKISIAKGLTGYIFIKEDEITDTLKNLTQYCDQIELLKPLQNCSKEALGKEYPYALKIEIKPTNEPVRLSRATSFWITPGDGAAQGNSPSQPLFKSQL